MKNKHIASKPKNKEIQAKTGAGKLMLFSKTRGKHKKLLIVILSIILLVGIGVGSFFIFSHFFVQKNSTVTSPSKETIKQLPSVANKIVAKQGYSAGQKYLDDTLKTTVSNSDKAAVYQSKAALARNDDNKNGNTVKEAVQYAQTAENLKPSANTAINLAIYAEYSGDKTLAIKYYEVYLSRIQKDSDDYNYIKNYVEYLKKKG